MKNIKIDAQSSFILTAFCLSLLTFDNGIYLFLPVAVLYLLLYMLQQPLKPGVFSLIVMQHLLQIAAAVWLCNFLGKDINYNTAARSTAVIASCIGLCFLTGPIIQYHRSMPVQSRKILIECVADLSSKKIMYLYIIAFFVASFLGSVAFLFGGLTQIIFSLVKIKWLLFMLFGYSCFLKKEKMNIFYLFVALEFLNGFLGFFSDFKTVIFFLAILIVSLIEKVNFRQVFLFLIFSIILGFFALVWTNIKGDYRAFLNGGMRTQSVTVEKEEALDKLVDLSDKINNNSLNTAVGEMLDRLQYTYHFAKTIDRVPDIIPFQHGNNWLESLKYAITPRLLNSGKVIFDATDKTKKYTGLHYSGREHGASFSLGYFVDCFVDFGVYGMMGMLFMIGLLYRYIYGYLITKSSNNLIFNYAVVSAFFLEFNALEMDSTYLLGRLFASVVTFFLLIKYVFPKLVSYISINPSET